MVKFSLFFFVAFMFVTLSGCGSSSSVKKGDRFVTLVNLEESADIQTDGDNSDAFTCRLPKGSVLEALYDINSSGFFECKVVETNGKKGEDAVVSELVPQIVIDNSEGFESFTITFSKEYIGSKLKKLK